MIFLGIGANLPSDEYGPPRAACGAALCLLEQRRVKIISRSRWLATAPVPAMDQPWFVNGVVAVDTDLAPQALMETLLDVEAQLGRRRGERNAARVLDLDIIAYDDLVIQAEPGSQEALTVPHPRMAERAFVMRPLAELAPDWRHPVTRLFISELTARLPANQETRTMEDADGRFGTEWHGWPDDGEAAKNP